MPEDRLIFRGRIIEGNLAGSEVLVIGPGPWPPPPGCTMGGTEICDGNPRIVRIAHEGGEHTVRLVIGPLS